MYLVNVKHVAKRSVGARGLCPLRLRLRQRLLLPGSVRTAKRMRSAAKGNRTGQERNERKARDDGKQRH